MSFLVNRIHSFAFIPLPLNENSPQTNEFYGRQNLIQNLTHLHQVLLPKQIQAEKDSTVAPRLRADAALSRR